MNVCTLLFLLRDNQILLAMKKRGFGQGRWNGVGGKVEPNETIEQTLVRECQEEIGVTPVKSEEVALLDFVFPSGETTMRVHVFISHTWQGKPQETEEMAPQWFKISDIPYDDMWQDDRYWLPQILAGQKLHAQFTFDNHDHIINKKIHQAANS